MEKLIYGLLLAAILTTGCGTAPETAQVQFSVQRTGDWLTFSGAADAKKVVLISGDEEYRSEEALPQLAAILSKHHGYNCSVHFAQRPDKPGYVDPNYLENIPGLHLLDDADLMILFTRFRALPDDQMQHIDRYLKAGKPVIAIRTATHAFRFQDTTHAWRHYGNYYEGELEGWEHGFGRRILGERWYSHHGHHKHQSTRGRIAPGAGDHPVTNGIEDGEVWGPTDVYGVRLPMPGNAQHLILGEVVNRQDTFDQADLLYGMRETDTEVASHNPVREASGNPNDPMMPIVWTKAYQLPGGQSGTAVASTIGSSTDLLDEETRRIFVNATYWCLGQPVPEEADVTLVGSYEPTAYQFHTDEYWQERNIALEDIVALY